MGLLTGIRIVAAVDGWAGPLALQLLADQGADVVIVEQPGTVRRQPDLVRLRGARSVAVDCTTPDGSVLVERLCGTADVLLLEPQVSGAMRFAADPAVLIAANPRLVVCRITGYGDEGPLAGAPVHDHLVAARYGLYSQPGWRSGPTFLTAPVPSLGAALLAIQGIGSALYQRERTGHGQVVTTSLLAGALASQPGMIWADGAAVPGSPLVRGPLGYMPLYRLYQCADGEWIHLGCLSLQFQQRATKVLDLEAELAEVDAGGLSVPDHQQATIDVIAARMLQQPYAVWARRLEAGDIPYARAQHTEDLLDDPQVVHLGLLTTVADPTVGAMQQMAGALEVDGEPWEPRPAPHPGEHTDALCLELGLADTEIALLRRAGVVA